MTQNTPLWPFGPQSCIAQVRLGGVGQIKIQKKKKEGRVTGGSKSKKNEDLLSLFFVVFYVYVF
ncbi:hypothetical protein HanIR_Chr03g0131911 [Helianthus annuus]|nr:hypothetical protein HanIR_Chr03g0131911 [Helianthus annuus]